jgi:guanylate kinase
LQSYKAYIKRRALMAGGTTMESYLESSIRTTNSSGYDPIDEIIITTALELQERYINIFGLLYNCHSLSEINKRLRSYQYKALNESTINKYFRDSRKDITALVTKNPVVVIKIKKALNDECEKS